MASPTVASVGNSSETATTLSHDVVMPSGIAAGNLLLLVFAHASTTGATTPSGWTLLITDNTGPGLKVYYKFAAGGEADFVLTTAQLRRSVTRVYRITGAHPVILPEGTKTTGSSTIPDPPNYGTSFDGVTQSALWFAVAVSGATGTASAFPTNYADNQFSGDASANAPLLAVATRGLTAASENPGTFTVGSIANWTAATIAIAPVITRTCSPALSTSSPTLGGTLVRTPITRTASPALANSALTVGGSFARTPAVRTASAVVLAAQSLVPAFIATRSPAVRSGSLALSPAVPLLGPGVGSRSDSPRSQRTQDTSVGSVDWTPATVTIALSNDIRASAALPAVADATSHYGIWTSVLADVPGGSTILGIKVEVERSSLSAPSPVRDFSIRLVKGGVISGEDKASAADWPTTDAVASYGGPTDLWGLSLTAADVSAEDFGIAIAVTKPGSGANTARIDQAIFTIYLGASGLVRTAVVRTAAPALAAEALAAALAGTQASGMRTAAASLVAQELVAAASATRTPTVRSGSVDLVAQELVVVASGLDQFQVRTATATSVTQELVVGVSASRVPAVRSASASPLTEALVVEVDGVEQFQTRSCVIAASLGESATAIFGSRVAAVRVTLPSLMTQEVLVSVAGLDQFQTRSCDVAVAASVLLCDAGGLSAAATRAGAGSPVFEVTVLAAAGELRAPTRTASPALSLAPLVTVVGASRTPVVRSGVVELSGQLLVAAVTGAEQFQVRACASSLSAQELLVATVGERSPVQRSCESHSVLAALTCEVDGVEQFQTRAGAVAAACGSLVVAAVGDDSGAGSRRAEVVLVAQPLVGTVTGRRVYKRFTARTRVAGSAGRRRPVAGAPGRRVVVGSAGRRRRVVGSQSGRRAVSGSAGVTRLVPGSGAVT